MPDVIEQLDEIENRVMRGLKDFQKATVNHIDYLYRHKQQRVLVSDEVGLGKTLIAKGVVAKMAKLRKEEGDDLFKVVYICSNSAIAKQNIRKLQIADNIRKADIFSSRLSTQHLVIFEQENDSKVRKKYIQVIPLTPETSFRMTTGSGLVNERALMFAILKQLPELKKYLPELEVIMKGRAASAWNTKCKKECTDKAEKCNLATKGKYFSYMTEKLNTELNVVWYDNNTYLDAIINLCCSVREGAYQTNNANNIINCLRRIFAKISLEKLNPDLVIMDEFQRFKFLLQSDPDSDTGMLANKFFNDPDMRILLLSATPYKMYSTPEEIEETQIDEHYEEFLKVMNFLNNDANRQNEFLTVWKNYSVTLKELTIGNTAILAIKKAAEDALYRSICRTERASSGEIADATDDRGVHKLLDVKAEDITSYIQAKQLVTQITQTDLKCTLPVDYIKSVPFLMSFMKDYQLKRIVENYFIKHSDELYRINKDTFWLNKRWLNAYKKLPDNNARLTRVKECIFKKENENNDIEKLLWIPPSRPYYALQGVFKNTAFITKTLVFSSWEMVPRMLACMLSYEAERLTVGKLASDNQDKDARYFSRRRYPSERMKFALKEDKTTPASMALFCLLYPSQFLTECYDPIICMNEGLTLRNIQESIKNKITEKLKELPCPIEGKEDDSWYYLAPLLLDDKGYVDSWLNDSDGLTDYEEDEKRKRQKAFPIHLKTLKAAYNEIREGKVFPLGKQPKDLVNLLTDMAIASPAICINRTYRHYLNEDGKMDSYLPSELSRVFIKRMNTPEATAAVELAFKKKGKNQEASHWRNLLIYCKLGNLQAVFDEYAHLISSGMDRDKELVDELHEQMMNSLNIRTTLYNVDTYPAFVKRMQGQEEVVKIRTHFAVAFTKGDGQEKDTNRKVIIRNAFNSPFRPFVLATTSIGQEGLDFHNYCRRIVHWNLPSNPIDLEQREGRINRFECLAIRQNVAKRYGNIQFKNDIWVEMFEEAAKQEKTEGSSDLIPFWGLKASKDMVKIERIVPMYPFSVDEYNYERLIKILSLYRLTLGQARQEELLNYLFKNCKDVEALKKLFINLSPFYKEKEASISKMRMQEQEDMFSNFKGLTPKDIEYLKSYKGPSIDELIAEMKKDGEQSE